MNEVQTLNQYIGTDSTGVGTTIVAPDMTTACSVYNEQMTDDPITMQCTKTGVRCVLPDMLATFRTSVYDVTGVAATVCKATPEQYTLVAGTQQVFTAIEAEGWEFQSWKIDGVEVADAGKVALLTIPSSESIVEIQAVFKAVTV